MLFDLAHKKCQSLIIIGSNSATGNHRGYKAVNNGLEERKIFSYFSTGVPVVRQDEEEEEES